MMNNRSKLNPQMIERKDCYNRESWLERRNKRREIKRFKPTKKGNNQSNRNKMRLINIYDE